MAKFLPTLAKFMAGLFGLKELSEMTTVWILLLLGAVIAFTIGWFVWRSLKKK